MKKIYATIMVAMLATASMAQEQNDTTYVMMNFTENPWGYPVTEVTSGWSPNMKEWGTPGAILADRDFSWTVEGSKKVTVTLNGVDIDESEKVPVFGRVEINEAEASSFGVNTDKINVLYTCPGTTMRFEAPEGYKFGKMVFYCFHSPNFMVGDEYEEEYEYEYNGSTFKQKLKVWKPTSSKKNQYDYDIWEGDEKNILFNYPYFTAHFVKINIRLVPEGSANIHETANSQQLKANSPLYDLQGRQTKAAKKGIYVSEGRKIVK